MGCLFVEHNINLQLPHLSRMKSKLLLPAFIVVFISAISFLMYHKLQLETNIKSLTLDITTLDKQLSDQSKKLIDLKNQDQYKINKELEATIKKIETTYLQSVKSYEKLLDLKNISKKTEKLDSLFADSLTFLYSTVPAVIFQSGSTALWSGGYKVGPGRNIPNAILFVNK